VAAHVDRVRAAEAGASVEQVAQSVALAVSGQPAGLAVSPTTREAVRIVPRLAEADRSSVARLLALPVPSATGPTPLARFVAAESTAQAPSRWRKNLRPVIYVTGDVAGRSSLRSMPSWR